MRQELDEALVRDFPNLYANRHSKKAPLCWGFECGDGWEPLIRALSVEVEAIIAALPKRQRANTKATQVKEKFGTLRFYLSGGNDAIYAAIERAEKVSAVTCEECGCAGKIRSGGWIRVLCDAHEEERQKTKR